MGGPDRLPPSLSSRANVRLRSRSFVRQRKSCASRNREAVSALVELGQLPARTRPRSLSASELEDRASALLKQDSEDLAQARARLHVLADWHARFGLGPAFQAAALARASIVAATCVGLGGLRGAESVEFDLVVVDEASKATAPELLIPLARAQRIVLVGDDRQLPPYIEEGVLDEQRLAARSLSAAEVSTPLFTTLGRRPTGGEHADADTPAPHAPRHRRLRQRLLLRRQAQLGAARAARLAEGRSRRGRSCG